MRRLWHYTHLSKAARIAEEDTFQLTFGGGPSADNLQKSKLRNFYLSTSSIPSGRYGRGGTNGEGGIGFYPKSSHVLIELNASKISDNYKIKPVNYWGKEFKNMDETEERIVSRNSSMPARKYIEAMLKELINSKDKYIEKCFFIQNHFRMHKIVNNNLKKRF